MDWSRKKILGVVVRKHGCLCTDCVQERVFEGFCLLFRYVFKRVSKWNKYNNIIAFYKEISTMTILNTWLATETLSRKPEYMTFLITNLYLWIGTCRCKPSLILFIKSWYEVPMVLNYDDICDAITFAFIRFIHKRYHYLISEPGSETYTIKKRSLQYGGFLMLTSKCILVSTEGQTLFWITRF